jgi:hypothetical protein
MKLFRPNPKENILSLQNKNYTEIWEKMDKPVHRKVILEQFSHSLTHYEKLEIRGYRNIYYFGLNIVKIQPDPNATCTQKGPNNWGYNDKKYL